MRAVCLHSREFGPRPRPGVQQPGARREAGEVYIRSHACEGWRSVAPRYDDGGSSVGTMERPALKRLLDDVEAGVSMSESSTRSIA